MADRAAPSRHRPLPRVCQDFAEAMQQILHLINESSNTRKPIMVDTDRLWEPPTSPIARLYFNKGWRVNPHKASGHESAKLTKWPHIVFANDREEAAYMQIMKSNILAMWVAWEAFAQQVSAGSICRSSRRARICIAPSTIVRLTGTHCGFS